MGKLLSRNPVFQSRSEALRARERHDIARDAIETFAVDAHRPALTFVDSVGVIDRWTFEDVAHAASRWGALLRSRGLRPGDRLLVQVGSTPAWPTVHIGALRVGLVPIPCPSTLDADAIGFWAERSGTRIVVTDRPRAGVAADGDMTVDLVVVGEVEADLAELPVNEPRRDPAPEAVAFMFVSGATGAPEQGAYGDADTPAARPELQAWLDTRPGDLAWCSSATRWEESIWNVLLGPWSHGAEIVLHEGHFDPEQRFELLQRLGVTVLCQTADEYRSMATHSSIARFDLARLRQAVSVGGPLDPEVAETFRDLFGLDIVDRFAQTQSTPAAADAHAPRSLPAPVEPPRPTPADDFTADDVGGLEESAGVDGRQDVPTLGAAPAPAVAELSRESEQQPNEAQPEQDPESERRDEAEARRRATAMANEDKQRRKQEEQRLRAEAKAAADDARREAKERRVEEQRAEQERRTKAREDERRRKEEAQRLREEAAATAEQIRRQAKELAAEEQRAEQERHAKAREDERRRKEEAQRLREEAAATAEQMRRNAKEQRQAAAGGTDADAQARKDTRRRFRIGSRKTATSQDLGPGNTGEEQEPEDELNYELIARLSRYGSSQPRQGMPTPTHRADLRADPPTSGTGPVEPEAE
jgi:hypothetical protein